MGVALTRPHHAYDVQLLRRVECKEVSVFRRWAMSQNST